MNKNPMTWNVIEFMWLGVTQKNKLLSHKHFNTNEYAIFIIISTLSDLKNQMNISWYKALVNNFNINYHANADYHMTSKKSNYPQWPAQNWRYLISQLTLYIYPSLHIPWDDCFIEKHYCCSQNLYGLMP